MELSRKSLEVGPAVSEVQPPILVLAALELERDAILRQLQNANSQPINGNPAHFGKINGYQTVVMCLRGKGNVKSAAKTASMLQELRPQFVLLIGIAGGANNPDASDHHSRLISWLTVQRIIGLRSLSQGISRFASYFRTGRHSTSASPPMPLCSTGHALGDLLVADQIVDYESGKQEPDRLIQRPTAYPAGASLLAHAKELISQPVRWIHDVQEQRPDGSSKTTLPQVHVGTITSGEKIQKSPAFVASQKKIWSQLVGIDMEAFGVAMACHEYCSSCECLVLKAICDWADGNKNDVWQRYAADVAATFAAALIRTLVPPECRLAPEMIPRAAIIDSDASRQLTLQNVIHLLEAAKASARQATSIEAKTELLKDLFAELRWDEAAIVGRELEAILREIAPIGAHVKAAWVRLAQLEAHNLLVAKQAGKAVDASRLASLRKEATSVTCVEE